MARVSLWNWDNDWVQRNAINEMDQELSDLSRRQSQRLHRTKREFDQSLRKVGSQIDSVSGRIDTVLEWTELRFQLLEFDEYSARKQIRKSFRALAGGMPATAPEVEDVPGYWMTPAATAMLRLLLRQGMADLNTGLETARERDPIRAELFNLCVGVCFDQPSFTEVAVLRLLDEAPDLGLAESGQVAAGWRAMWEHTVRGEFGASASDRLTDRLRALFDSEGVADDENLAWDEAIRGFGSDGAPLGKPEALRALAEHLRAADGVEPAEAPEPDERWRLYLQELIEEPSPAELPLVEAMEELHLPDDEIQRSEPTWAASAGTVGDLLRRDLFDPDAHPAQRELALRLCAPLLRSRVEVLSAGAVSTAPITRVVKRPGGITVEVGSDGHDKAELEQAERALTVRADLGGPSTALAVGIGGALGLLALISALFGVWFLAVVLALAIAIPVWRYLKGRSDQARRQEYHDSQIESLRTELARVRDQVGEDEKAREKRAAEAREARDELLAVVPEAASSAVETNS